MKTIGANRTKIALGLISTVKWGIAASSVVAILLGAGAFMVLNSQTELGGGVSSAIAAVIGALSGGMIIAVVAGPAFAALGVVIGGAGNDDHEPEKPDGA